MPRAATTTDAFNTVAEPRPEILDLLATGERPGRPARPRPTTGVEAPAGAARGRARRGARRRAIHDWTGRYERMWEQRFARLDAVLAEFVAAEEEN